MPCTGTPPLDEAASPTLASGVVRSTLERTQSHRREQAVQRSRLALAVVLALGTCFTTIAAHAAMGWKVVKSRSINGPFAFTAINATIATPKPRGIAVRFIGKVNTGNVLIGCTKGFSVSSASRVYKQAGLYVLPMTRGADGCHVAASIGGSGKLTVQILKR